MKKLLLSAIIASFAVMGVNAQDTNFGVKAGADFATITAKVSGISVSASETGFYVGGFAEIGVTESLSVQPEVLYVSIKDSEQISIPIMAKFSVTEQFDIMAGPALGYILDADEATDTEPGTKSFNYGVEAGIAYNITDDLFVEARYNIGLANLVENAPSGFSAKISGFFVGLGYRL